MNKLKKTYFICISVIFLLVIATEWICVYYAGYVYDCELSMYTSLIYAPIEIGALIFSAKSIAKNSFDAKKHIFSDIALLNIISILSAFILDIIHAKGMDYLIQLDLFSFAVVFVLTFFAMAALAVMFVLSFLALLSRYLKMKKLSSEKGKYIVTGCLAIISVVMAVAFTITYGEPLILMIPAISIGGLLLNIKANNTINEMFTINNIY